MTKKKTMKNIKTPNKFNWGGDFKQGFNSAINNQFSGTNMGAGAVGALGALGSILEGVISNGFSTTGGSILSGVGDAVMQFNPIAGGAIKVASGVVNRGFGTKWDSEGLAKAESQIDGLNNFRSGASDFDTLAKDFTKIGSMNKAIKAYDLGEDGWFVDRTYTKAAELNADLNKAYNHAIGNVNNVSDNIDSNILANLERNYAAFGGLLPRKKFAYGGQTHGADFTNGLIFIDNGGTHESNPYEGIPISMDREGKPNLVEEGEVVWNDYVFSNRLKVPKAVRNKYKLRGTKDLTFADAVEKASKESEERPNDPISMRGLENILMNMAMEQEFLRAKDNTKREGNKFGSGGPHRGHADDDGFLAWAEKNGISVDDYYTALDYLWKNKDWWKANITKNGWADSYAWDGKPKTDGTGAYNTVLRYMQDNDDWRPAEEVAEEVAPVQAVEVVEPEIARTARYFVRTKGEDGKYNLTSMEVSPWEGINTDKDSEYYGQYFNEAFPNLKVLNEGKGADVTEGEGDAAQHYTDYYYDDVPEQESVPTKSPQTWMRYAPIVGNALSLAHNLANDPDYSNADAIIEASQNLYANPIKFNPIGDYMTYNPFDTEYHANQLRSIAGATRRNIINTSGGNRSTAMSGILASDYNSMNQIGDLYRKAAEYNLEQRQKVAEFNRATNQFNSEGAFRADQANQTMRQAGLDGIIKGYIMKEQTRALKDQAIAENLSGIFEGLGDIGYENFGKGIALEGIRNGVYGNMTAEQQAGYTGQNYAAIQRRQERQQRRAARKNGTMV
jgi:hypothetical protein